MKITSKKDLQIIEKALCGASMNAKRDGYSTKQIRRARRLLEETSQEIDRMIGL